MAGFYFSQTSVIIFACDLAAFRIIGVSVIAGCPQGESGLYSGDISIQGTLALVPRVSPEQRFHCTDINCLPHWAGRDGPATNCILL